MFDLKRPCVNCPFRKSVAGRFQLSPARITSIIEGPAFQCHKTLDWSQTDEDGRAARGDKPQQCAGLIALLDAIGQPNAIMRVALRTGHLDPAALDRSDTFTSVAAAVAAHNGRQT